MTGAPRIFAYNPDLLTPEETKAGFIARSRELEDALDDLRHARPQLVRILDRQPGRIAALRMLSGGNPRALVLVHQILAKGGAETALDDVEALLDLMTPLYKAKFEALSAQQQSVVDAVAIAFDPIATAAIAERIRLPVKHASAVLGRLVEDGVLDRVTLPRNKTAFLISERLFNIWYLMRASRRARRSLTWLVKFYESFYGAGSTEDLVQKILERAETSPREAQLLLACAMALPASASKRRSEVRAIEAMLQVSEAVQGLDLRGEDRDLAPIVDRMKTLREIKRLLANAPPIGGLPAGELVAGLYLERLGDRLRIAKALGEENAGLDTLRVQRWSALCASDPTTAEVTRLAAAGTIGDCDSAPLDIDAVPKGYAMVVASAVWHAGVDAARRLLDENRYRRDPSFWVGAILGATHVSASSALRAWLRENDGAHRDAGVVAPVFIALRGDDEPVALELALAVGRAELPPVAVEDLLAIWSRLGEREGERNAGAAALLRAAIDSGTAPELIDSLAASPDAERLRPALEAARAAIGDGSLVHLAPEIRAPAEHLLRFFQMKIERWDFEPVAPVETQTRVRTPAKKPGRARKSR